MAWAFRVYSVYSVAKLAALGTVLLLAAQKHESAALAAYGTQAQCDACLAESVANPNSLYEFGACGSKYPRDSLGDNLLLNPSPWRSFQQAFRPESGVAAYVPHASTFLGLSILMVILFAGYFIWQGHDVHLVSWANFSVINVMLGVWMMVVVANLYGIYLPKGTQCFVSVQTATQYAVGMALLWAYIILMLLTLCVGQAFMLCMACLMVFDIVALVTFSVVGAVEGALLTNEWDAFLVILVAVLTTVEIPSLMFAQRVGEDVGDGVTALQAGGKGVCVAVAQRIAEVCVLMRRFCREKLCCCCHRDHTRLEEQAVDHDELQGLMDEEASEEALMAEFPME